jgi:hypothetical protein
MFSYVPKWFPMMFPKFSICSSRVFPITPHIILYPLPKVLPFSPIFWGASQVSLFFGGWWANQNGLLQKKTQNLGGSPSNGYNRNMRGDRPLTNSNAQKTCVWEKLIPIPNAFQRLNVKDVNQNMICFKCFKKKLWNFNKKLPLITEHNLHWKYHGHKNYYHEREGYHTNHKPIHNCNNT